jgi:hypothetical protein
MRKPVVFYAIPCGAFYSVQASIIQRVSRALGVEPIIAEDSLKTLQLWEKIARQINQQISL